MSAPTIRLYVVAHDVGFAPNPYFGYCTLACCRRDIRRRAHEGDYLLGFGSSTVGLQRRLVYFMKVQQILSVKDYSTDARFTKKTPHYTGRRCDEFGDRAYYRDDLSGQWTQLPSFHSHRDGRPNPVNIEKDTSAPVLVSQEYCYWGREAIPVPAHLDWLPIEGRKGKPVITDPSEVQPIVEWLETIPRGRVCGDPAHWDAKQLARLRPVPTAASAADRTIAAL